MTACLLALTGSAQAATWTWSGALGTSPWNTDGQWTTSGAPDFNDSGAGPHGEDLVFPASPASSAVNLVDAIQEDAALSITFDAGAPAYIFQRPNFPTQDIDLWGTLTNNSANIQTFSAGMALEAGTVINATNGGFDFGDHLWIISGSNRPTYNGPFNATVNSLQNGGLINIAINNATITLAGGSSSTSAITVDGNGAFVLNGAWNPSSSSTVVAKNGTGTVVLNAANNNAARPLTINAGAVRMADSLALGNSNTGGTGASNRKVSLPNANGTLQLANGITVSKAVLIAGRTGTAATAVAMQNFSGNNTYNGNFEWSGVSANSQINFGSSSGKLTVTTKIELPGTVGTHYFTFRGAGDGEFNSANGFGTLTGADNDVTQMPVVHYGSGTLTLNAPDNYRLGHQLSIGGGTLKYGAAFANDAGEPQNRYSLFAPTNTDAAGNFIRFHLENNSKLDFSTLSQTPGGANSPSNIGLAGGGLLLSRVMSGSGTIIGNVQTTQPSFQTYAALRPGTTVQFDADGVSILQFNSGVGTMHFTNDLNMADHGQFQWQLSSLVDSGSGSPGANWDSLLVDGLATLGGTSNLLLSTSLLSAGQLPDAGDPFWTAGHTWKVLDSSLNNITTNFTLDDGTGGLGFTSGAFSVSLSPLFGPSDSAGDVYLNFTPVPEPSAVVLASLTAVGIVWLGRTRRKSQLVPRRS